MIYRKLDANGDYTFGGNSQCFVSDSEAVRQAILTRLKLLYGEWWETLEDGLPLWQKIIANRDIAVADSEIKKRILGTENVVAITRFERIWDNDRRKYRFDATVDTRFGTVELKEVELL